MGRKAQVKRSAEEKWEILQEGLRSGNISETCRKHGIAANLWYRWKDEAEQGSEGSAWGGEALRAAWTKSKLSASSRARAHVGPQATGDRNPKKRKNAKENFGPELQESVGSVLILESPSIPSTYLGTSGREKGRKKYLHQHIFPRSLAKQ